MQIKLTFLGAAGNVTGSRFLLEADGSRVLVDCGLYQERQFRDRNWQPFVVDPAGIDAVLLTHAHLDHCGLLPKLAKEGFKGPIYCTGATAEIAKIVLLDSAKLQAEDAAYKAKRHAKEGRKGPYPVQPLYTVEDTQACLQQFTPIRYQVPFRVTDGIEAVFSDAGHILGSSIIRVNVREDGELRSVLFSGDIGRPNRPIVHDPEKLKDADYVLVESTYGNRVHEEVEDVRVKMAEVINRAVKRGGCIVVPSFSVERAQEILYHVNGLYRDGRIPEFPVFLDSPMAAKVLDIFEHHSELFDEEAQELVRQHIEPFNFPHLTITQSTDESKSLNEVKGPMMIIAGSGMCTGGRVKHHLVQRIARPENTVMFVGYQAVGTLGRRIVDGENEVRILGRQHPVNAEIVRIHGFSAHADKFELLKWLKSLKRPPIKIFVVHGEQNSAKDFAKFLHKETGWKIKVPAYRDTVKLN